VDGLSEGERESFLDAAQMEIQNSYISAYQALKDHLIYLTTIADKDPDQWEPLGFEDRCAYLLAYSAGTDLSPDKVHT
jgi:hypothetical protein